MDQFVSFLSRQSRGATVAFFAVFWGVAYMVTNHFPLREPLVLPLLPFESDIPFVGWTLLIYLSAFPQAISVVWLLDRSALAKATAAAYVVVAVHALIFAVLPTTYPRPVDPSITPPILDGLYRMFYVADSPRNCFPSLHVSMGILLSMAAWSRGPRRGMVFLSWSFLITLSTLTTKQHYALDAFGGAAIAVVVFYLVFVRELSAVVRKNVDSPQPRH